MDFAVQAKSFEMKEKENIDKYLDLAWEKKLWNIKRGTYCKLCAWSVPKERLEKLKSEEESRTMDCSIV